MYKVRTAKREFRGSCGHPISAGSPFVVEEPRPSFHCANCGKAKVDAAHTSVIAELSSATAPVVEAAS